METQYFYLIAHTVVGDDLCIDKIFLQKSKAVKWGKVLATKNPSYSVGLYRQAILSNAVVKYVKQLKPFENGIKDEEDCDSF